MIELGAALTALQPLVPITVIVAVVLFLFKEALEWIKRRRADARKLGAIKRIVARDLEVNAWVVRCYRDALNAMEMLDIGATEHMRIYSRSSGRSRHEHWEGDDAIRSGGFFPTPVTNNVEKYLLDAATLDQKLLQHMEATATSLAELDHIRMSTIEQLDEPVHRPGFVNYARLELKDIEADLTELYRYCTGKTELAFRIR